MKFDSPNDKVHRETDPAYVSALRRNIVQVLKKGPLDLAGLIKECAGAFPVDVVSVLATLLDGCEVSLNAGRYQILMSKVQNPRTGPQHPLHLPHAHPLDFDWRFTLVTRVHLLAAIDRYSNPDSSIVAFGAPTLFSDLIQRGRRTHLVDKNPAVIDAFRASGFGDCVLCVDLLTEEPLLVPMAELVIADPPWYPEHYRTFINHSSRVLTEGGYLFLSVPGWLTRPTATQDRREIVSTAVALGFDIAEVQSQSLQYESPDFETAVLHAAGIDLTNWRYGDLFVFRKTTGTSAVPVISDGEKSELWHSFSVGGREVRVLNRVTNAEFEYAPATDSSILPSVSRRFAGRSTINVWTSRNEAFTVSNPQVVIYLLQECSVRGSKEAIEVTATQLRLNPKEKARLDEFVRVLNLHNP